jgi:acyl-coenzyme A thioesterase PaaI-like protein
VSAVGDDVRTHRWIDRRFSGRPVELAAGSARVELEVVAEMAADERGLAHGGFVFGLADHAAMLAVNHPRVVLAAAEVRFTAPVAVGDRLVAEARLEASEGRKRRVTVTVSRDGTEVLAGSFVCVVPDRHVLDPPPVGAR